jgi:hypothetical protein
LTASRPIPAALADVPRLEPAAAGTARTFWLAGRRVNGKTMDMDRIDDVVAARSTEIREITTLDALPHNFHDVAPMACNGQANSRAAPTEQAFRRSTKLR